MMAVFHAHILVIDCFALAVALFAGTLLSGAIGSTGALVAFLTVGAIVDVISMYAGPTRWLANQAQQTHGVALIQFLAISIRLRGQIVPVIGVSDLMFFTVCVSALRRLGWPEIPVLVVPVVGILSALVTGLFAGLTPAIPFLAAAVSLYVYASYSLKQAPCRS